MNSFSEVSIIHKDGDKIQSVSIDLIGEEPLSIRIDGKPYSVVMRTPGDEIAHAAGFCLTEGIADIPEDITAIACCDGSDSNVVTVTVDRNAAAENRRIPGPAGFYQPDQLRHLRQGTGSGHHDCHRTHQRRHAV